MGLIVSATLLAVPIEGVGKSILIGNVGAFIGSVVSVRLMLTFTKKLYGPTDRVHVQAFEHVPENSRVVREGSISSRLLSS